MKKQTILFAVLIPALAFLIAHVIGVRYHFEAIPDYFPEKGVDEYRKLSFSNDNYVVGRLIKEDEANVELEFYKGSASFPKNTIEKMETIPLEEMSRGSYASWAKKAPRRPIITLKAEDSVMPAFTDMMAEILAKTISKSQQISSNIAPPTSEYKLRTPKSVPKEALALQK